MVVNDPTTIDMPSRTSSEAVPSVVPAWSRPDRAPYTLLYDGECPVCAMEVRWLLRRDRHGALATIDIADPSFSARSLGLDDDAVSAILHGIEADGTVRRRMDAVRGAYEAVGLGWMMTWSRWPGLRWLADLGYRSFAANRMRIGRMLGRTCDDRSCPTAGSSR